MPWRAGPSAIVGVLLLVAPGAARADDPPPAPSAEVAREQSRAAFMRGVADAHLGHYTAARDAFAEAYELFAHPSILLNLGIARWHTGEYIQAEKDLGRFLSDDGGASSEDVANARAGLAAVRQHLGTVRVRVSPDGAKVTIDDQQVPLTPGAFADARAVVGPSELRVELEGYEPTKQSILVTHDAPLSVDLTLRPLAPGAPATGAVALAPVRRDVAYGALGLAAVSAIVWAACGVRAIMLAHEYDTPTSPEYQEDSVRSSGVTFRTTADVFFVTALAAGGAGAYLLLFPSGIGPKGAAAAVALGPGSLRLEGRF